jgi:hypothetical protein
MNEASAIPDGLVAAVLSAALVWEPDPEDQMWLRAVFDEAYVYMRINDFPDENLYSLWLGEGRFLELEEMPTNWRRPGTLEWPSTARPIRRTRSYMD